MKNAYDITVPLSKLECKDCYELNKIIIGLEDEEVAWIEDKYMHLHRYENYCDFIKHFYKAEVGRPQLEAFVYYPHLCCLETVKYIQSCKDKNWISDVLFDEWMKINGGDYQLGRGGRLNYLWDERKLILRDVVREQKEIEDLCDISILRSLPIKIIRCDKHHNIKIAQLVSSNAQRKDLKILNKLFPFGSEADKQKTNIDLASLAACAVKEGLIREMNEALKYVAIGVPNVMATAICIHGIANPHASKMFKLIKQDKACCLAPAFWNKYAKSVTTAVRRTAKWADGTDASLDEVASLAYWEMCVGRSSMLSDWEQEYMNRVHTRLNLKLPLQTQCNNSSNDDYLQDMRESLRRVAAELVPSKIKFDDWPTFCRSRQSWLSSGSSGGEHFMVDGEKVRVNKRTYFETIPIEENIQWLYEEPRIDAVASEKFEQSKPRAIYGTKPKDYSIMAYAITYLEANLHRVAGLEGGLIGADEMRSVMRRVKLFKDTNYECLMVDYADFNIQHTLKAQAEVFKIIRERLEYVGVTGDILLAFKWCEKACLNQWVKFPQQPESVKVVQGLFSGNRATNFLNTLLNISYFLTARTWAKRYLGLEATDLYNLHQGDDVYIIFKNRVWGIGLYAVMKANGFIFQDSKQLQDRNRAEFLRVLYTEEGARGYPARAIGTLILRPLQGEEDIAPDARVNGLNSQIALLHRRGLTKLGCKVLWEAIVPHGAKSSLKSGDTVNIPIKVIKRNYLDGGLDAGPPGTMAERTSPVAPIPSIKYESEALTEAVPKHTTNAWIEIISSKFKHEIDDNSLREMLHRVNISDSLRSIDKARCLATLHTQIKKWQVGVKELPNVTRTYDVYNKWWTQDYPASDLLRTRALRQLTIVNVKCDKEEIRPRVETLIAAISASPFKDVNSAVRALHGGVVNAVRAALKCSKNTSLAMEAIIIMDDIERRTSRDILARVITGVRGIGGTFESRYHPIVISWINKLSLENCIIYCLNNGVKSIPAWDEALYEFQQAGICLIKEYKIFEDMSKY